MNEKFFLKTTLFFWLLISCANFSFCQVIPDSLIVPELKEPVITETDTDTVSAEPQSKSPRGAMLRSVILPGWGQFYNGKWFKALLVAGTEIGLVVNAAIQDDLADKAGDEFEREFYLDSRNLSYWWLAGVTLLSMIDAYVDAHLYKFDESTDLSLRIGPDFMQSRETLSAWMLIALKLDF